MSKYSVKLNIADTVIQIQSRFPLKDSDEDELKTQIPRRSLYQGRKKIHILINVEVIKKLPVIRNTKHCFITYHFPEKNEDWRLLKKGESYIYTSPLPERKQLMIINRLFDRVTAYFLPQKNNTWVWYASDVVYEFLQVLLINYFAQRRNGIFAHAVGVRDLDGKGLLFFGKSGAGKTTLAKLWHRHSKAAVLNDDRIIVCKNNGRFFIHCSPWYGNFNDYLNSKVESAPITKIFFIRHARGKNSLRLLSEKSAFNRLYPAIFPTFWNRPGLENIVSFCQELIKSVPCYELGFVKDKDMIGFVRKTSRYEGNSI